MRLLLSTVLLVLFASAAVAAESDPIEAQVVKSTTIQTSATVTSAVAARLQPGDQILVSECSGRWCAVTAETETSEPVHLGYVRSGHIAPLDPAAMSSTASTVRFARTDVNQVIVVHPGAYNAYGNQRRPNEDLPLLNSGPDYIDRGGPPPEID